MKVTAGKNFNQYRNKVIDLDLKDFRALQKGEIVEVSKEKVKKFPSAFKEVKDVSANKSVSGTARV